MIIFVTIVHLLYINDISTHLIITMIDYMYLLMIHQYIVDTYKVRIFYLHSFTREAFNKTYLIHSAYPRT